MSLRRRVGDAIEVLLFTVLGVISYDTLLRLLDANAGNTVVAFVRRVARLFLRPFDGMFDGAHYLMTAIVAAVTYCLLAAFGSALVCGRREPATVHARVRPIRRNGRSRRDALT